MRFFSLFLSMLLLSGVMVAQKKYLVSPKQEVMPIQWGKSAAIMMQKKMRSNRGSISSVADCSGQFTYGYDTLNYLPQNNFGAYHKDVLGEWFVAKATGQIDTIYFYTFNAIGTFDSTISVRVHRSIIGPDYGPGSPATPHFNPPCQNWGYWVNTNDADQGVAAFIEESTGPWVSTINGSAIPATPPFSNELWGLGGFPKKIRPNTVERVVIADLFTTLPVTLGDKFFVSMKVQPPPVPANGHIDESNDTRTEWLAAGFTVATDDEDYPARNWKFYEHDKGPSNCAGFPLDSIRRGWVARGPFTNGNSAAYNFWYTMTVTDNTAPQVEKFDQLGTTTSVEPRVVAATISDCNLADSNSAGVQSALIKWFKNGVAQPDIPMDYLGGDEFEGEIPGVDRDNSVTYRIYAVDNDGASVQSKSVTYRIVNLNSLYYVVDTSNTGCTTQDISLTGTKIDTSAFWIHNYTNAGTNQKDDGTAGPFDMGANFTLFGDSFRYAWVGVNGAIALSKTAADSNQVSSNGFATTGWDFPYTPIHEGPSDTLNTTGMPRMFISPMWADHIISLDSPVTELGRIIYGDNGNSCQFIVQWDSIAAFNQDGDPEPDATTFRVVLNRCTGIVEFQYENVGTHGLDSASLVGMQLDSARSVFVHSQNAPYETKPRNGWCVKLYPAYGFQGTDGWNMLSVAGNAPNYNKTALYPYAVSPAYKYSNGYVTADVLENGLGYWLKYDGSHPISAAGTYKNSVTVNLGDKWNMVGSISTTVDVNTNVSFNNATRTSNFFKYQNGYAAATTLEPGRGYWVKVSKSGDPATMTISDAPAAAPKGRPAEQTDLQALNKLTVSDAYGNIQTLYFSQESAVREGADFYEMPPVPVQGAYDVRFSASQRMLETYPATLAKDKSYEFPVSIQAMRYPVTIMWNLTQGATVDGRKFILNVAGKQVAMDVTGKYVIQKDDVTSFSLGLKTGIEVPKQFALGQNYPNPFNPSTKFTVDVPKVTTVEVAVFDILGRKVSTLMSGEQEAGTYNLVWNGTNSHQLTVPTGMYFIRMSAADGEFSAVRKVMLMK